MAPYEAWRLLSAVPSTVFFVSSDSFLAAFRARCSGQDEKGEASRTAAQEALSRMPSGAMKVVVARSKHEHESAIALVRQNYARRGYRTSFLTEPPAAGLSEGLCRHVTLLAQQSERAVGTLTLGLDSSAGLSVDEAHRSAVDAIRAQGRRVCELIRLAVDVGETSRSALALLVHSAYLVGRLVHRATDVFIEVNPRHAAFYEQAFEFRRLGEPKMCPRVQAPSVLMHLELFRLDRRLGLGNSLFPTS
jgi:hypothetical protein